jgi:hypothetical protein
MKIVELSSLGQSRRVPRHRTCLSDESTQEKLRRMFTTIGEPE